MTHETLGVYAALTTLFCWTVGTLSFTKAAHLYNPNSINRVRLLMAAILLTIITCVLGHVSLVQLFSIPLAKHWLWLGISGIIGLSIGDYFAFNAFKILGSSKTSMFSTFAPGAALIGGYFLLGEQLNAIGLLGMAISISGIIWFIHSNRKDKQEHLTQAELTKGIVFATMGALCQGLGLVFTKMGLVLEGSDGRIMPLHATWIRMFIATVSIYAVGVFTNPLGKEMKDIVFTKAIFKPVILGTFFGPVFGVSMSLYAASYLEVSLAQTIFSLLPISVILGVFLVYGERIQARSFIAAMVSILGVLVLVWRNEMERLLF